MKLKNFQLIFLWDYLHFSEIPFFALLDMHHNILIDGERIKQLSTFTYLGNMITQDARCNKEIEKRILIAKSAFNSMKTLSTPELEP